jgi:hypothetical protein
MNLGRVVYKNEQLRIVLLDCQDPGLGQVRYFPYFKRGYGLDIKPDGITVDRRDEFVWFTVIDQFSPIGQIEVIDVGPGIDII